MKTNKKLDFVEIKKFTETLDNFSVKIWRWSENWFEDCEKIIREKGEGIYRIEIGEKIKYWFFINKNMYVIDRDKDITKEELNYWILCTKLYKL